MSAKSLDGRWFRILTVIDQFTRECLALIADCAFNGYRVALALSQVIAELGVPESITADNGSNAATDKELIQLFVLPSDLKGGPEKLPSDSAGKVAERGDLLEVVN